MDGAQMLRLGIIGFLILAACAVLIGFIAPRCPSSSQNMSPPSAVAEPLSS
jgi:hypothetical protein